MSDMNKEYIDDDLISRRALYEEYVKLEQEALFVMRTTNDKLEKLIWSAILAERSSIKFSIADAPSKIINITNN